ncbi:unnamed protein product [Caenorhabditis angaria]|uniref:G-protein coupled receptors family 1 profile domain-containing protein n=1 Tax=Caenorhabditis angaria TaxID=860376 RepID=A0A9P1IX34_9PELO|nr:unnamed protein product [Caenorhabditis angaria]
MFILFHLFISACGIILNTLLIYAVMTKTPENMNKYTLIILNVSFTDLFLCFLDIFVIQRLVSCGTAVVYISMGLCSRFSSSFCFLMYTIQMHLYMHSIWMLFASYAYRYYVLVKSEVTRTQIQSFLMLLYIPSLVQMSNVLVEHGDETKAAEILTKKYPAINTSDLVLTTNSTIFTFSVMYVIVHMIGNWIIIRGIIIIFTEQNFNKNQYDLIICSIKKDAFAFC